MTAQRLIHCRVTVKTIAVNLTFDGFYHSTCDAIADGQTRAGDVECRVTAKVIA